MPQGVVDAAQIMQQDLAEVIQQLPDELERVVREKFSAAVKNKLPLPWSDRDRGLFKFAEVEAPQRQDLLQLFSTPPRTGYEVASAYFIAATVLLVFKEAAPGYFVWRQQAGRWYQEDIVPYKGQVKFSSESHEMRPGSGITLAHHGPADDAQPSVRLVDNRVWNLDLDREGDSVSPNMLALKRGVPYGSGVSGFTCLFAFFFRDIKERKSFDLRHALLGLFIYLVCHCGHPWNECLHTLNYLERRLKLGVIPECSDPASYVSDYAQFIETFAGSSTKGHLIRAVHHADRMTIMHRRKYCSSVDGKTPKVCCTGL